MSFNSIWASWRRLFASHRPRRTQRQRWQPRLESLEDRHLPSTASPASYLFDFGTAKSPVAPGATRYTGTAYNTTQGYGWLNLGSIKGVDRGTSNPLTRDFHQGPGGQFLVDLPNGTYDVSITVGDAKAAHDRMAVWLQGTQVTANISTSTVQFLTRTFQVNVTDGQLNMGLSDTGGTKNGFALNALAIQWVSGMAVDAGPNQTISEGAPVQFAGSANADSALTYSWAFGDGTTTSGTLTPSHTYQDNGTYIATLSVTDATGNTAQDSVTITVTNAAPTATFSNSGPIIPGGPATVAFTNVLDAGSADMSAGFRYCYDFNNDGTFDVTDSTNSSANVPSSLLAALGTRVVRGRIKDKDGGSTDFTTTILINPPSSLTAQFTNSGPVQEGSAGSVSFANVAGGNGSYLYSFDFDNNGSFEVVGSSSASATVPATFLGDGPTTTTVRGRVEDSAGAFADFTTTIAIYNVAPAATLINRSATTGSTLILSAVVNDSSAVDVAAGFTYLWNFGDGAATSALANPAHTYNAPGTYTVSVKVKDKDGTEAIASAMVTVTAPAPAGDFIITPFDKIPNFGANPTIISIASGNWSSASTWSLGRTPVAGDIVSIGSGHTVIYDVVSNAAVKTVAIQFGGHLVFRTDVDTRLTVVNLLVMEGGELLIGTVANPVAANVKAEVIFANVPLDLVNDPSQYGNGLIGLGKVTMHGAVRNETFVRLAVEPKAGDTTLTLSQPVTGWKAGDRLILPDTRHLIGGERLTAYTPQWESLIIQNISADGRLISLNAPLSYDHVGARNADGVQDFLPHVGNLTRNVVVRSQSAMGIRGHTMYTHRADIDIRYVQFSGLGRTTNAALNSTTYDSNGNITNIGTNQIGRYSVHFQHLIGPTQTPANGYQYTFKGNSVFCPIDPMPFKWGITIHDSHYGLISGNVLYNWAGAGIVTESGNESFNVIERNFVVAIRGDSNPRDNNGRDGSAFWFNGFNNYVRDNVAANAIGSFWGIVSGSGFNLFAPAAGRSDYRIPLFPCADVGVSGQYRLADINLMPLLEFARNEVYGATATGLTIWHLGTDGYSTSDVEESVVKDFRAWHVWEEGFYGYPIQNVTFDGFVVRGHPRALNMFDYGAGWTSGDYWAGNITIRNADIQGMYYGIGASTNTPGTFRIEDSYFRNYNHNITIHTLATPGATAPKLARQTVIDNVVFDPWNATTEFIAIYMAYRSDMNSSDLIQNDKVFVYNYNGMHGDDFRVYYYQQMPDFIVPRSGPGLIASPVAGLTNQQAWDLYGIAVAGEVAPSNSASRSGFYGLVAPL